MRAISAERFGGPEVLAAVDVPEPAPISTEALVEVHAAGVNPVDCKTRRGAGVAAWVGPPPFLLGWDVAGVVVRCGYGVTRVRPGDRVFGMPRFPRAAGCYAKYVTAPSLQLAGIPDGVSFEEASALPLAALTAWQALEAAGVGQSDAVLVNGAGGGVGHLAVQIAAALGASVIAATREEPAPEAEVDVTLDLVGGSETNLVLGAVRVGGTLLAIADGATDETKARAERLGVRVLEPLVEPDGRALDRIAELVASGSLRPRIESVLPLERAAEAHRRLEAGGVRSKLVLSVR